MNDYFKINPIQQNQIDFEEMLSKLEPLSKGAKIHFVWKFIQTFTPGMCRTLIRYGHQRLKVLNDDLPNRKSTTK